MWPALEDGPRAALACAMAAAAILCLLMPGLVDNACRLDEAIRERYEREATRRLQRAKAVLMPVVILWHLRFGSRLVVLPIAGWLHTILHEPSYKQADRRLLIWVGLVAPIASVLVCNSPELVFPHGAPTTEQLGMTALVFTGIVTGMACMLYARISRQLAVSFIISAITLTAPNPMLWRRVMPLSVLGLAVNGLKIFLLKNSKFSERGHQLVSSAVIYGWVTNFMLMLAINNSSVWLPTASSLISEHATAIRRLAVGLAILLAGACRLRPAMLISLLPLPDPAEGDRGPILAQHGESTADQEGRSARAFICLIFGTVIVAFSHHWYMAQWACAFLHVLILIKLPRMSCTFESCNRFIHAICLVVIPLMRVFVLLKYEEENFSLGIAVVPIFAVILYTRPAVPVSLLLFVSAVVGVTDSMFHMLVTVCITGFMWIAIAAKGTVLQNLTLTRAQAWHDTKEAILRHCRHKLMTPLAAFDLELRLLESDQSLPARFKERVASLRTCMTLILEILDSLKSQLDENSDEVAQPVPDRRHEAASAKSLVPDTQPACEKPAKFVRDHRQSGLNESPLVVMVVDDVACLRDIQTRHLRKLATRWDQPFDFLEATTGEACLERVMSSQPEVHAIIMDQYMQDAGGQLLGSEAVLKLRQGGFHGLVIGSSGNAEVEPLFMQSGADHFWQKPAPSDDAIVELFEHELRLLKCSASPALAVDRVAWRQAQSIHDSHHNSVARLVHDFGTPLATLCHGLDMNDQQGMKAALRMLLRLRDMLIAESRLSWGKTLQPRVKPCCVPELVDDVKQMTSSSVVSAGLVCDFVLSDDPPQIHTDATMMTCMLCNLVSNAIKHSSSTIRVLVDVAERRVRAEVHDDGPGVPPAFRERLFQPHQYNEDEGNNSGLGLWSVATYRCLCECHSALIVSCVQCCPGRHVWIQR